MQGIQINTQFGSNYIGDPEFYKSFTFCQFQRSATEQHVKIYHHFKGVIQGKSKVKIPLVYEIDDLLTEIPEWNFASEYYKENQTFVRAMLQMSDGVIVSTLKLKEVYSKFNKNIEVIPNHLPKFIWGDIYPAHKYKKENERIKILWAGSQNHFAVPDGKLKGGDFGKELMDFIMKTTDKYEWCFMGAIPNELSGVKDKLNFTPWASTINYPRVMKAIEPDIFIAPLEDNLFNACKSNIKQLEITACGAVGVYSDVVPYKNVKIKAKTDEEMISYIEKLADDIDYRAKVYNHDYDVTIGQLWWEEHGNLKKYINSYLKLFGRKLP